MFEDLAPKIGGKDVRDNGVRSAPNMEGGGILSVLLDMIPIVGPILSGLFAPKKDQ